MTEGTFDYRCSHNTTAVREVHSIDYVLFAAGFSLMCFGLVMVFSAGISESLKAGDYMFYFKRQLVWTLLSLLILLGLIGFDISRIKRLIKPLVIMTLLLLVFLLIPSLIKFGFVHPSRRWFRFGGFGFQPSEFAKIVVIIYLASILTKKGEELNDFYRGFLPPFIIVTLFSILIFLEPDFSTAFMIFFISLMMFFIAGIRAISLISLVFVSIPALYLMISEKSYRRERIVGFLNPWMDPTDKGYQIIQSFKAFALGGLAGAGLGKSIQKMKYLPIPHTDFIFAIIAEETGFIGVLFVIALYIIIAYRGYTIAKYQKERFDFYLAFGLTSLITWQAVFNIAVVTGLLPSTGISLPFLSYGGSSMVANSVILGLLLNLSRNKNVETQTGMVKPLDIDTAEINETNPITFVNDRFCNSDENGASKDRGSDFGISYLK